MPTLTQITDTLIEKEDAFLTAYEKKLTGRHVDNEHLKKLLNDVLEQERILRLYAVFAVFDSKCKKSADRKRKREDPEVKL
jgi:hypothetical protein